MAEQYAELRGRLGVERKSDGRSVYDEAAKKELIVACLKRGVSVARTAMEHGVNTNLLRTWIAAYQRRSTRGPAATSRECKMRHLLPCAQRVNKISLSASVRRLCPL